jgi:2-keto-4-pentenoate hydratase/2-oxohepta-3-ene-1,7-dioic acid hydratase in catechol pathway
MMRVIRFALANSPRLGLETEQERLDLTAVLAELRPELGSVTSPVELMEAGLFHLEFFREIAASRAARRHLVETKARLLTPIPRPGKVIALGLNYATHARESGREPPEEPIIFSKATTAVIGPEQPVVYKRFLTRVDPEVELGLVIGKPGANIALGRAREHIAAYTVVNDVTARDMQSRDLAQARPWFRSKSIDTFCPIGPCLVPAEALGWPLELDLEMRVNGERRQRDNTRNLIFDPARLVEFISRFMTLEPGDVIATGTPEGIAPVQPGDVMEAEVERIGVLRNPVVQEETPSPRGD